MEDHSDKDWLKLANLHHTSNFSWWLIGAALGVILITIIGGYLWASAL